MSYEREESKTTTYTDGREEIYIVREKSGSGIGEFLGVIAAITLGIATVAIISSALHQQPQTIIIQQGLPSN